MKMREFRIPTKQIILIGFLPGFLKKLIYKLKGYKIGKNVSFGFGSILNISQHCEIGDDTDFGLFSIITSDSFVVGKRCTFRTGSIIIVPKVKMGNDVIISETAIIRAQQPFPDSEIFLDDRVHIFPKTIIDPSRRVSLGKETAVGFSTYIFSHGAYKNKLDGYPVSYGEVHIGKSVWLPCNIFIMPGVTLGDDVVVGTGSNVTKSFEAGSFILGQPAKLLKTKEEFVRHYSVEQKIDILKKILQEFNAYIEYFSSAKVDSLGDLESVIKDNGVEYNLIISQDIKTLNSLKDNSIIFVLDSIGKKDREILNNKSCSWFSQEDHQCSKPENDSALIFRKYLGRFGIYFEQVD